MKDRHSTAQVKQVNDDGSVRFRLTSKKVDRHGEVVLPDGIKLENFKSNPVVLFGHGFRNDVPIGKIDPDSFKITSTYVDANIIFDEEGKDPFAEMIGDKVRNGFLNAGSIGFRPEVVGNEPVLPKQTGATIQEWELFEFSVVPIPSNADALAKREFVEFREQCKATMDEPEKFDDALNEFYLKEGNTEALNELIIHKDFDKFRSDKLNEMKKGIIALPFKTESASGSINDLHDIDLKLAELSGKAGRVLSSKNRTLVKKVAESMEGLLDELKALLIATEPKPEEGKDIDEQNLKSDVLIKNTLESIEITKLINNINDLKRIA